MGLYMDRHRAVSSWFSLSARMCELGGAATWLPEQTDHLPPPNLGLRGARLTFLKCLQYVFASFCSLSEPGKNKNGTWQKRGVAGSGRSKNTYVFFYFLNKLNPLVLTVLEQGTGLHSLGCLLVTRWCPVQYVE